MTRTNLAVPSLKALSLAFYKLPAGVLAATNAKDAHAELSALVASAKAGNAQARATAVSVLFCLGWDVAIDWSWSNVDGVWVFSSPSCDDFYTVRKNSNDKWVAERSYLYGESARLASTGPLGDAVVAIELLVDGDGNIRKADIVRPSLPLPRFTHASCNPVNRSHEASGVMNTSSLVCNDNAVPPMTFEQALARFVSDAQVVVNAAYRDSSPQNVPVLTTETGKRYVRVVRTISEMNRSVFCFIDTTNGDVLKAASWKTPAKNARGNIYSYKDVRECITGYGAHYNNR